jgi:hypothetical protein
MVGVCAVYSDNNCGTRRKPLSGSISVLGGHGSKHMLPRDETEV